MRGASEYREMPGIAALFRRGPIEESRDGLDAKDTSHRIVHARLGYLPGADLGQGISIQFPPAIRRHQHVDAGEERRRAAGLGASGYLLLSVPIADHEAREAHAALQDVRDQIMIAVQLGSVPAVVRGHYDQRARVDRSGVSRRVHGAELRLGYRRIALVTTRQGAAVAQKVLDRRQGVPR